MVQMILHATTGLREVKLAFNNTSRYCTLTFSRFYVDYIDYYSLLISYIIHISHGFEDDIPEHMPRSDTMPNTNGDITR